MKGLVNDTATYVDTRDSPSRLMWHSVQDNLVQYRTDIKREKPKIQSSLGQGTIEKDSADRL